MKKSLALIVGILSVSFVLGLPVTAQAKRKKKSKASKSSFVNPRIQYLSGEDLEMFGNLTKSQQKTIKAGKIKTGYNAWMVTLSKGSPFYKSENHPVYTDYEEVWLYIRNEVQESHSENKIIDPVTNWPSIHKKSRIKSCQVGDEFVMYDRGVVEKIIKDNSGKTYGSCTISTEEAFIPIRKK